MNQYIVFVLMNGGKPEAAYANEETAQYDCWLCNSAERFGPDPMPYWVQKMPINMEVIEASPAEA